MKLSYAFSKVVVLSCFFMALAGCDSHRDVSPILPGEQAVLVLTFSPSPVYESSNGEFEFIVFVDEVNNVGATLTSVKLENLDEDGEVVDTDNHDQAWIERTFGTSYIGPFGRIAGSIDLEAYNSARETWWLRGTDDNGNSFTYQGSVELINR